VCPQRSKVVVRYLATYHPRVCTSRRGGDRVAWSAAGKSRSFAPPPSWATGKVSTSTHTVDESGLNRTDTRGTVGVLGPAGPEVALGVSATMTAKEHTKHYLLEDENCKPLLPESFNLIRTRTLSESLPARCRTIYVLTTISYCALPSSVESHEEQGPAAVPEGALPTGTATGGRTASAGTA
jgi:hypothetical protein